MFGLNYHHQPSGGGNVSMDLSVDFYNLYDSDFYNFSINASSSSSLHAASNIFHNSTQTLDGPELSTQVPLLTYYHQQSFHLRKIALSRLLLYSLNSAAYNTTVWNLSYSPISALTGALLCQGVLLYHLTGALLYKYGSSNFFTLPNATRVP